ncbi:unnamed protein product [Paramecium sonneborni]|uniref:RING-type domain-containing protein n=1 Tax=Paramecium sonneborni TaxID=65129 RepID=A0A8S1MZV3_9CILI|nr:unnamed protein product [Paramecium sonneborni]
MNYQSQLNDSLIEQNQTQVYLPNFLFEQARNQLLKKNQIKIVVSSIKYCLGMLVIILKLILQTNQIDDLVDDSFLFSLKNIEYWLYLVVIHSFIGIVQYKIIQKFLINNLLVLSLALKMDLVNIIVLEQGLNQQQLEQQIQEQNELQNQQLVDRLLLFDQRNITITKISEELYEKLQGKNKCLIFLNKFMILIFFIIEMFAILFLFYSSEIYVIDTLYYYICMSYMILVVIIGLNQYFSTFALAFLYIIFLPIIIGYQIYQWFRKREERSMEKKKVVDIFDEIIFDKKEHQNDINDCAICMCSFEDNDKVIILTCSEKHVFHTDCIVDWLKLNSNCPLCRKQVVDEK